MAEFNNEQMAGFIKSGLRVKHVEATTPKAKGSGLIALSQAFKKMSEAEQQKEDKDNE
ncbi:hypothetical protein [Peribacillus sp. YIM B13482]|uniref:hypothetical protein n=1 Tax=Peribacillus sp. YIM B13482 TaxID=3366298 RepID=UPI00366AAB8D